MSIQTRLAGRCSWYAAVNHLTDRTEEELSAIQETQTHRSEKQKLLRTMCFTFVLYFLNEKVSGSGSLSSCSGVSPREGRHGGPRSCQARGKILHTRNHKHTNPLENATESPLSISSKHPLLYFAPTGSPRRSSRGTSRTRPAGTGASTRLSEANIRDPDPGVPNPDVPNPDVQKPGRPKPRRPKPADIPNPDTSAA